MSTAPKTIIIAGPCLAESFQVLDRVAAELVPLMKELDCEFYFKASFDKANRTSASSARGPGLELAVEWFQKIKEKYRCKILTDIHESYQIPIASKVCDGLQIPAFLCRQTDLIIAAVGSGCFVNVKKGQFLSPSSAQHIVEKAKQTCLEEKIPLNIALTERGSSFGYGDLLVDMRSFPIMAAFDAPVIFDITHSTQQPPSSGMSTTGGKREFSPVLARSVAATGYASGFFLEIHPDPKKALSDAASQLTIEQGKILLRQVVPMLNQAREWRKIDKEFIL